VSDDLPFRLPPVDPGAASAVATDSLTPELLAGLLADGDDELAAWVLEQSMAEQSRAEVYDGILRDAMRLVGERWRSGQWTIAEEHLASRTLLRTLERVRPEVGPESRIGPLAVLAGVAGEHHMIGLVCLEQALVENGWTVANLGADMPAADLAAFVRKNDVALVAMSASNPNLVGQLADTVQAVRDAAGERSIPIAVGGQIAAVPNLVTTIQVDAVVHSVVEAVAFADQHLPAD
jgi:MerR family transcriptional regulator, light-induced transcriptional regulator